MKRKIFPGFLMLVSLCLFAQELLNNESILKLWKAGIGENTIVAMIKAQPSRFSLSSDDLIALKNRGVSEKIIVAMIAKAGDEAVPKADDSQPEPPLMSKDGILLPDELGVYWLNHGKCIPLRPEILNLRTLGAELNGWLIKQHSRTLVGPDSDFVLKLPEGTDAAEYVCVRFRVKRDRREVELARGGINVSTGTYRSDIPFTSEKLAKQIYRLKFESPLKAGEYGLLPPGVRVSSNATSVGKTYTFMVE